MKVWPPIAPYSYSFCKCFLGAGLTVLVFALKNNYFQMGKYIGKPYIALVACSPKVKCTRNVLEKVRLFSKSVVLSIYETI